MKFDNIKNIIKIFFMTKEEKNSFYTNFYHTCTIGDFDSFNYFIEQGVDIYHDNSQALKYAAGSHSVKIVEFLVIKEKNKKVLTEALERSAFFGNIKFIELYLKHGAKINKEALSQAIINGEIETVKFLLENEKSIFPNCDDLKKVLDKVYSGYSKKFIPIIKYLILDCNQDIKILLNHKIIKLNNDFDKDITDLSKWAFSYNQNLELGELLKNNKDVENKLNKKRKI